MFVHFYLCNKRVYTYKPGCKGPCDILFNIDMNTYASYLDIHDLEN